MMMTAGVGRVPWLGVALVLVLGAGCPFNPTIPNGRVVCTSDKDCPSSFTCQKVASASIDVSVCCKEPGCAGLSPSMIRQIENAVTDAGAGRDAPAEGPMSGDVGSDSSADAGGPPPADGAAGEVSATCNNGSIEPGETCDPISSCPTACPQVGCDTFELTGSAAACTASCEPMGTQKDCRGGDGCCPTMGMCTTANDSDCACVCGNGTVEASCGEVCDPLSTCPTTCPPMGCMLRRLTNEGTCRAQCVSAGTQSQCLPGDGCCPSNCNATNDNDCSPKCGNGVLEMGEKCDGDCPASCPAMGCQRRTMQGTVAACTAECVNGPVIEACTGGDGCCAAGCTSVNDSDCNCRCGNGAIEPACNETCEGSNCPTSCPPVGCQLRTLQGAANMCTARCVNGGTQTMCANGDGCCPPMCNANNDNNCTPSCGNSVVEAGEKCDPPSMCQTQSNACVSDANNVRTRTGVVASCTFQCTTVARTCSGTTSDTFCPTAPTACMPCGATCAAGQDIDCKLPVGTACTHANQCPMGFCSDGVCCGTACSGACDVCTGGTCALRGAGAAGVPSCTPYLCANAATCPTTCSSDAGCASTHYCATTCQPKKANGTTCTATNQCTSGLCVDGYCCNSSCTAPCDRCNRAGMLGTCATATLGTFPSPSCGTNYACNGATTACPPVSCSTNSNCLNGTTCQGTTCQPCDPAGSVCTGGTAASCCSGTCFNFACQ